ncbi:RNA polymerase sigma factor [Aestuariibaculum marinum]|uniref:RNA polymerase sigma-70 factor n=1 Tax=Aestuariibaculum marinum TaxID=2683592 RepID=A0A8J6PNC8_9FLAO|nr:RNA polymerase sigma-70 factor [Aestuariibaculum marinum]MBD0822394.1 RNA polymerase sigma-70 factor [Aestuariibaculum marinum]
MSHSESNHSVQLIKSLKKGDKDAFKSIFNIYFKRLCVFALKYVDDQYTAEEIVENTLLKLWQKRSKLDKVENLKSYLYTMVRNACVDYNKQDKRLIRLDIKKHENVSLNDAFVVEEETHAALYAALETLPEKCRKVFELSCLDGIKYKDIAEDLQISLNTVKSQRARAISLLKIYLKDHPFYAVLLASL